MDTPPELTAEEEALYEMTDDELKAAMKEAQSAEIEVENEEVTEDAEAEEVVEETEEVDDSEEELDETEDVESEEDSDTEEEGDEATEQPEEGSEDAEETNSEEESEKDEPKEEVAESEAKPQKLKYKANGQEFEFTQDEVLEQFGKVFGQSMNYTQKMQEIKPWRKTISALRDNELSHDDVNLMIDALKGDKDAITSLVKKAGVDTLDLETEKEVEYTPKEYGRSDRELAIDDVVDVISKDPEYKITQHVVDTQWDPKSRATLADNPDYIAGLHDDIKSGVFDKVSPMAMKMKVLDGGNKPDIEYYMQAGSQYYAEMNAESERVGQEAVVAQEKQDALLKQQEAVETVKQETQKQEAVKKQAAKRKAAAPTRKAAGKRDVVDYLDDNDEQFDEWYKKLESQM